MSAEREYKHNDGTVLVVRKGIHGLDADLPSLEGTSPIRAHSKDGTVQPIYLEPGVSFELPSSTPVASRQNDSSDHFVTFDGVPIVEFICFGFSHRYFVTDYPDVAPYWRQNLFTEIRDLARALQYYQALAYEYLEADGSLGAWMANGIRWVQDMGRKDADIAKAEDYNPLMKRLWSLSDDLKRSTAEDYPLIHETGIELVRIRYEGEQVRKRIQARINELIGSAEVGEMVTTKVESYSFTVLDWYGQVRYSTSPASLAAYRCGVLMLRAGASFAGEKIADGSNRSALQRAGVKIREDLPKAITGLFIGYFKKRLKDPSKPSVPEALAEEFIGVQIWLLFFTIDFYVFVAADMKGATAAQADEAFHKLLRTELAIQIAGAVIRVGLVATTNRLPANAKAREWLGRLAAALPALVGACIKEYAGMKNRADAEGRPFYEVLCAEAGWALVRIAEATAIALAEAPIQNAMRRKMQSDLERWDVSAWRAIILAIQLEFSQVDTDKLSSNKQPVPKVAGSPARQRVPKFPETDDADLEPLAWNEPVPRRVGPPKGKEGPARFRMTAARHRNPARIVKPAKPHRAERKKVATTKAADRRAGKEFSEAQREALFLLSSQDLRRKWPSNFARSRPHYMCENGKCRFVHYDRSLFNVDHVWDIQHGGSNDKWSAADIQKMIRDNDPQLLIIRGYNAMLLCKGCNLAKNRKFDNTPGMIPDDAGYAKNPPPGVEDQNPDVNPSAGGRPMQGCFPGETPVVTPAGPQAIQDITPGDAVLAYDVVFDRLTEARVRNKFQYSVAELLLIQTAAEGFRCSPSHPLWVNGSGWKSADTVRAGDYLRAKDGCLLEVLSLHPEQGAFDVFDLEVELFHNFHVARLGLLVHNKAARYVSFNEKLEQEVIDRMNGQGELADPWELRKVEGPHKVANPDPTLNNPDAQERYQAQFYDTFRQETIDISVNYDPLTDTFGIIKFASGK